MISECLRGTGTRIGVKNNFKKNTLLRLGVTESEE